MCVCMCLSVNKFFVNHMAAVVARYGQVPWGLSTARGWSSVVREEGTFKIKRA